MIRVVLADDEALVRDGMRTIICLEPDLDVVGEAADGAEAVRLAVDLAPDVVLLDIRMPVLDGLEATRRILAEPGAPKVIVLTTFDRNEYVYRAITLGASAFLLKDVRRGQLTAAIRAVVQGETLVAPATTRRLVEEFCRLPPSSDAASGRLAALTTRELEVLRLVARGMSNAEIATALVVAETTVKTHVARVLAKLDLRDRVQAVVLSYETGLVRPGLQD
jgi:DNA-binding NarL/FixJ family response regulator